MNCDQAKERLAAAMDIGRSDPEADQHCLSCAECADTKQGLETLFSRLDDLPKPAAVSGEAFLETLPHPPAARQGLGETWRELCELLARQPAVGIGLALVCFSMGILVSRPAGSPVGTIETIETVRTLESLTEKIAALDEAVAIVQLEQVSASERLEGLSWIGNHGTSSHALIGALADVLVSDENVNVRLAAVDALAGVSDEPAVRSLLIQALKEPQSPLVSIALIENLVPLADPVSVALFQSIAADESIHEAVRERALAAAQTSI